MALYFQRSQSAPPHLPTLWQRRLRSQAHSVSSCIPAHKGAQRHMRFSYVNTHMQIPVYTPTTTSPTQMHGHFYTHILRSWHYLRNLNLMQVALAISVISVIKTISYLPLRKKTNHGLKVSWWRANIWMFNRYGSWSTFYLPGTVYLQSTSLIKSKLWNDYLWNSITVIKQNTN